MYFSSVDSAEKQKMLGGIMLKTLKQLFCRHKWVHFQPLGGYMLKAADADFIKVSGVFICVKCGKREEENVISDYK